MKRELSDPLVVHEGRDQFDTLQNRARNLALAVSNLVDDFPRTPSGRNYADQLVRCATSTACNHRAARRARSRREWIAKLGIVEEEADEIIFWTGLSVDKKFIEPTKGAKIQAEASEILSIVIASIKTARSNAKSGKKK